METQLAKPSMSLVKRLVVELICYAYIILFIYAGVYKLLDFNFFRVTLAHSPLIAPFAGGVVYLVPIGELIVACLLFTGRWRLIGLYLATGIMIGFTAYITYLLYFSPNVPCHCGGILTQMGWTGHLILNSTFVLAGLLAIYLKKSMRK